jgi:AcrR family transcriptional regulator
LVRNGPEGLRVEPVGRELGATKGSFYWHFKDLSALKGAMLIYWQEAATHAIINRLGALPRGLPRLEALVQAVNMPHEAQGGAGAETAIRAWGRTFAPAGIAVGKVDAARLAFLKECLADMDIDAPELPALFYAAHLGLEQLSMTSDVKPAEVLMRLVGMLRN